MVVIDTNMFEGQYGKRQINVYTADSRCHSWVSKEDKQCIKYCITQSVFREIIQQRLETHNQLKVTVKKVKSDLGLDDSDDLSKLLSDALNNIDHESLLTEYLQIHGIDVIPMPTALHSLADRAFSKKLPFKGLGDNGEGKKAKHSDAGFKDALLWESLLLYDFEGNGISEVYFLTHNMKDFRPKDDPYIRDWDDFHPNVKLEIYSDWDEYRTNYTRINASVIVQNIEVERVLELFRDENDLVIEVLDKCREIHFNDEGNQVIIEALLKNKNGKTYVAKYVYDLVANDICMPDDQ